MFHLRPLFARRAPALRQWRAYSTQKSEYQPPAAAKEENPHRAYYQSWGMPVMKVFLGALFTYQVIYLSWLKLEEMEEKHIKDEETKMLEGRLAELSSKKDEKSKS